MQNIDLNLLYLLNVLYEERSVSRTAERLFLTPSAISHALRRLRLLVGDDLFARGPGGMVPTARAQEIAQTLGTLLPRLNAVLQPQLFDPASTQRSFAIACVPYLASTLIPRLAAQFHDAAPYARLDTTQLHGGVVDDLDSGELDIALGNFRRTPANLVAEDLLRETSMWVMSRRNPLAGKRLSLDTLAKLPHVDVVIGQSAPNSGDSYDVRRGLERLVVQNNLQSVESAFAAAGLHRDVRWRAPDSMSALAIVARSAGVTLVPESAARFMEQNLGLAIFDAPYPSTPLVIQMLYHGEFGSRPAIRWLIECIQRAAASSS